MATPSRRTPPNLIDTLFQEPQRFEFFQAVRLLEWTLRERGVDRPYAVGGEAKPQEEVVRFQVANSFSFPASAIEALQSSQSSDVAKLTPAVRMLVNFLGLTGPNGVLPEHYTDLLIRRGRLKDYALRDFFDIFNHRSISLFYRAWEKYRFPFQWERGHSGSSQQDLFTQSLRCLVGMGTAGLDDRMAIEDSAILFYAGHFARPIRSAMALEQVLSDFFHLPVRILQFQGRWLTVSEEEQTCLSGSEYPGGRHDRLGHSAMVGDRVWDVRCGFTVLIENLTYDQFARFMPDGTDFARLGQLTQVFAGLEFTFDVQPKPLFDKPFQCELSGNKTYVPRLGWNTWMNEQDRPNEADMPSFAWDPHTTPEPLSADG